MKTLTFVLIILLAFALRFWRFTDYFVFSLEEMNILYTLEKFTSGNWSPLLGQEATGYVHHLFHPPWYIYIFSIVYKLFSGEPLAFGYIHILLGVISVLVWCLIGTRLKNLKLGFIAAFLCAISFQMISIDRSAWAVGLIPFATTLSIYFLITGAKTKKNIWLILLGLCLGFTLSLHYQALILIFFVASAGLFLFGKRVLYILASFLLTLAPLIFFDLRHNLFNVYGLVLATKTIISGNSPYSSNHYLYFLFPFIILLSACLLSKIHRALSFVIIFVYVLLQLKSFLTFPVYKSYQTKNTLVTNILDHYNGKELKVSFRKRDSFEYKYLLFLRAKNRGINTNTIFVYEPWQGTSPGGLIIESDKISK